MRYILLLLLNFLHCQDYDFSNLQFEVNNRKDFNESFVGLSAPGFYLKDLNNNDFFLTENLNKPTIINFFNTMPKLRHVIPITNPKTKVKSEVVVEGLASFLG